MLYELSIIKYFLSYQEWCKWKDKLSVKDFPKELIPIYSVLDNFHQTHQQDLSVHDLANLVLAHQARDPDYYRQVLSNLESLDVSSTSVEVLLTSLHEQKLLKEISLTAYDITEGKGDRTKLDELLKLFTTEEKVVEQEFDFISDDVEFLLDSTFAKPGLRWRLKTLNNMLGSIRPGDFGFLFARPETGKTTFLASEATYMASQLSEEDGPIIWLNNEEQGNKVKVRCYQAALGASLAQINSNRQAAHAAYMKATKGKLRLLDPKGTINKSMVEKIVRQYKPSLVIYDQIDKITGFEADREDLKLGYMYQWARELGKEHGFPSIAVCQADGTGEGVKWLTMSNVANSKTAKQAEADWILGIGKTHDIGYEQLRYLHLSKNKLSGDSDTDPAQRHGRQEVIIRADIARYEDIK